MTAAIVIISCLVVLALAVNAMLRHRREGIPTEMSSSTAEAMLGVIGTLFSVLLGLLVAGAIERYHDVMQGTEAESNGVINIFRLARGMEETDRKRIRGLCREYAQFVVDDEWPLMQKQQMSENAQDRYTRLWDACISANPTSERENNVHAAILDSMDQVGDDRRARAVTCTTPVPFTLWAVIICGSLITIAFTHLFTQHMGKMHWMMTTLVALSLGLNVWLLAAYSTPFSGDLAIQPAGFQLMIKVAGPEDDSAARYLLPSEQSNAYAKQTR